MNQSQRVIAMESKKMNPHEMSINNQVLAPIRNKLDAALMVAAHVANGSNAVTVSMKLIFADVAMVDGEKIIHAPKWSVKVSAKTSVFDEAEELNTFIVTEDDGQLLAIDVDSRQVSMDDLAAEGE